MNKGKILIIALLLFRISVYDSQSQIFKKDYNMRNITVNYPDSTIKTQVILDDIKMKVDLELDYYWCLSNKINVNRGGLSGFPLHGKLYTYDLNKNLLTDGNFNKGVKTGVWKKWDSNGNIISAINWKNGKIEGTAKFYEDNKIIMIAEYRNNLLEGEVTKFYDGEEVTFIYEKGVMLELNNDTTIVSSEEDEKKPLFKRLIKKEDKEEEDIPEIIESKSKLKNTKDENIKPDKNKDLKSKDPKDKDSNNKEDKPLKEKKPKEKKVKDDKKSKKGTN